MQQRNLRKPESDMKPAVVLSRMRCYQWLSILLHTWPSI